MMWCDFCQIEHSSSSCFHPGKAMYDKLKAENKQLREALENIANLGLQVLPVDKRWGTAFSIAREALEGGAEEYKEEVRDD